MLDVELMMERRGQQLILHKLNGLPRSVTEDKQHNLSTYLAQFNLSLSNILLCWLRLEPPSQQAGVARSQTIDTQLWIGSQTAGEYRASITDRLL